MKNFLSFLLVLMFSVGSFGVVFAAEFTPGGDIGGAGLDAPENAGNHNPVPDSTAEECADANTILVNGICVVCSGDAPVYRDGACITRRANCEASDGSKWDSELCSDPNDSDDFGTCCIGTKEYCNDRKKGYDEDSKDCRDCNSPEVYDDLIKDCHNPNLTPSTILPNTEFAETDCEKMFLIEAYNPGILKGIVLDGKKVDLPDFDLDDKQYEGDTPSAKVSPLDVLGCAIKTGRVKLWMVPFYIKYLIQFALSLAGLVAVGSMVIGGYFYLFGSFADDKDKGKRAVIYGIVGFVVAILSWTIVNIVIAVLTR
jgi:hypothetical protein